MSKLSHKQIDRSYRNPNGLGFSPSLQRARKPFIVKNIIVGSLICAFAGSVYWYSISAVKQDDFSDLEDLLPPLETRQQTRSIEDDLREAGGALANAELGILDGSIQSTNSPGAISKPLPGLSGTPSATGVRAYLPRRLSDLEWVRRRGWVESGTGNLLVWGAPGVDNVGRVEGTTGGPRLV